MYGKIVLENVLKKIRIQNLNRVVIAHLNINSIRNKFTFLAECIKDNIDILVISETKIDDSFPTQQFMLPGFSSPFRFDRNQHGGGLLVYTREDIPCRLIHKSTKIESLFIEVNLRKQKWLLCTIYVPNSSLISAHIAEAQNDLDIFFPKYENFLMIGDFNADPRYQTLVDFCQIYGFKNLVKEFTCFKNPSNPSCIDFIFTNKHLKTYLIIINNISFEG